MSERPRRLAGPAKNESPIRSLLARPENAFWSMGCIGSGTTSRRHKVPYRRSSDRLLFALSAAALSPYGPNVSAHLRLAIVGAALVARSRADSSTKLRQPQCAPCIWPSKHHRVLLFAASLALRRLGPASERLPRPTCPCEVHRQPHHPYVIPRIPAARSH